MIFIEGAIVQHTWGYGQTNQDFYEIIKRTPKTVVLRELDVERTMDGFMQGMCWPLEKQYRKKKEPFRMRVFFEDEEKLHPEFGWMKIWDGEHQKWTGYY
jgi:hypothetical protein